MKYCLSLMALGWFGGAWAQTLVDPTRPPAAWLALQPGGAGAAALGDQDASSGVRVTVVGRTKKFAVIDGQVVKPGDSYNGTKVLAIKPGEVVVRENDAAKSLKLAPGVVKKLPARTTKGPASKRKESANGNGGNK